MLLFQSLFIYTIAALLLFYLGKSVSFREKQILCANGNQLPFFSYEILSSIIIFASLSGIRYNVGVDHLAYLNIYLDFTKWGFSKHDGLEPGFLYISNLFSSLNIHFFFWFFFWGALQIGFVYYAFRNNKYLIPYLGLCIMLGSYYLDWMNGIRQCVAMCAFVFIIEYSWKKKFLTYLFFILLASTIHKSALILIPLYFILQINTKLTNRYLLLSLAFICAYLGNNPTWLNSISYFENFLQVLGYDAYSSRLDYIVEETLNAMNWGPGRISIFVIGLVIIWFYPLVLNTFVNQRKKLQAYFLMFIIGFFSYNLFANTSHIFLRPIMYFTVFTLPLSAFVLYTLKIKKKHYSYVMFLMLACSNIYINILKTAILPYDFKTDTTYFKFFWDYML